ncbi:hypothetical protein VTN77DRAFT_1039 [Rasamsonia byssochlamydoides]|uniref:uncharacterized protein n=1 Tax=Rasamsonia byssochlamydoides TaxID=89139 RepID=UPI003742B7CE
MLFDCCALCVLAQTVSWEGAIWLRDRGDLLMPSHCSEQRPTLTHSSLCDQAAETMVNHIAPVLQRIFRSSISTCCVDHHVTIPIKIVSEMRTKHQCISVQHPSADLSPPASLVSI